MRTRVLVALTRVRMKMRPYEIKVGSKSNESVLMRDRMGHPDTEGEESTVKTGADVCTMCL